MFSVIFPGQGSQTVGMGKNLYNNFSYIKELFDKADEILGISLSNMILNGPKEELDQTENTQPAIFLVGYSIFQLIKKDFGINLNKASYFVGHSLGEYTALVCAGSLTLERATYLLHERGKSMQEAVAPDQGAMIAVLGMNIDDVQKEINLLPKKEICEIANDNCNGQIVVSGKKNDIDNLRENLKKKKKKGILLHVSAPFHCSLMKQASIKMKNKIECC